MTKYQPCRYILEIEGPPGPSNKVYQWPSFVLTWCWRVELTRRSPLKAWETTTTRRRRRRRSIRRSDHENMWRKRNTRNKQVIPILQSPSLVSKILPDLISLWIFLFLCKYSKPYKACLQTTAICSSVNVRSHIAIKSHIEPPLQNSITIWKGNVRRVGGGGVFVVRNEHPSPLTRRTTKEQ